MSDPVKNTEVEDVLSSIRRLVSEDKRPKPEVKPAVQSDRLVLTPALRVEEDTDAKADLEAEEEMVDEITEAAAPAPEDDYSDDPYKFDDDTDTGEESDEIAPTSDASDHAAEDASAQALSAKIAALETAIGDITDEWEPDSAGTDDYAGSEGPAMAWEDVQDEETTESAGPEPTEEAEVIDAQTPEAEPEPAEEPADAVEEHARAPEPEVTPEEPEDDPDIAALGAEDQLLDEDVLREMITEIVQSELRGEMGERITRNVRRLVRREIHRALTARDLD